MIKATIKLDGLQQLLGAMQERAAHLQPILQVIGVRMQASTAANFAAQGRPTPWTPLAPSTLAKRRNKGAVAILQDTGRLKQAATNPNGTGTIFTVDDDSVTVGVATSVLRYAAIHQFGGTVNIPSHLRSTKSAKKVQVQGHSFTIPARPYMVLQEGDVDRYAGLIKRYVTKG